jgi:hypothetical protein
LPDLPEAVGIYRDEDYNIELIENGIVVVS